MTNRLSGMRRRAAEQSGVVIVWMALSLVALLLVVGFAVDLGSWYLRGDRMQRAADAAALAGASRMPDAEAAVAAAGQILGKNNVVDTDTVTTRIEVIEPNRVHVEIHDADVPVIFARFALSHIELNRSSMAQHDRQVALGSPFNALGVGDVLNTPEGKMNYWAAVNGYCTPREDGDLFLSRYMNNKQGTDLSCDSGQEKNPDYDGNGYTFVIDVPPAASSDINLRIYDAAYAPGAAGAGGRTSPDVATAQPQESGEHGTSITTNFTVRDGSSTGNISDMPVVTDVDGSPCSETFETDDRRPGTVADWFDLCTLPGDGMPGGHSYVLQVQTLAGEDNSYGSNAFGIHAAVGSSPNQVCDARISDTCPQVFALNALSIYSNIVNTGGPVRFYLADISTGFVGKPVKITLFDPGEGADSMKLLLPDLTPQRFDWVADPESAGSGDNVESLDVSGLVNGVGKFNDTKVELETNVPGTYLNNTNGGNDTWWHIEYQVGADSPPTDRTTWMVGATNDKPVHLVRNP